MSVSSPVRTVCLLTAMLAGSLTAAWSEAPATAPLPEPRVTLTVNADPKARTLSSDARTRLEAAIRFMEDRGETALASDVRTLMAEGRILDTADRETYAQGNPIVHLRSSPVPGGEGKAGVWDDTDIVHYRATVYVSAGDVNGDGPEEHSQPESGGRDGVDIGATEARSGSISWNFEEIKTPYGERPLPAPGSPEATAEAFRLAVSLASYLPRNHGDASISLDGHAGDDSFIFDRWGRGISSAMKWLTGLQTDHLKVSDTMSPRPTDRLAWARSIADMASFTEAFFTSGTGSGDDRSFALRTAHSSLPLQSEEEFREWCLRVRQQAGEVTNRTVAAPKSRSEGPGRGIDRGTIGEGEGGSGREGFGSGSDSVNPGSGAGSGGEGASGSGGSSVGAPMP